MTTCDRCGWELRIGDYPFCGNGHDHVPSRTAIITDDIPGGQVIETLDHDPMTFYSKRAIEKAADARGLRLRDQWAGPHDKYLTNWAAAIDAKTLDDKRVLLSRGAVLPAVDNTGHLHTFRASTRTITKWSEVE